MDTDMVGTTTRRITFNTRDGQVSSYPAGTMVYVRKTSSGLLSIRIPGTIYTQTVDGSSVKAS